MVNSCHRFIKRQPFDLKASSSDFTVTTKSLSDDTSDNYCMVLCTKKTNKQKKP